MTTPRPFWVVLSVLGCLPALFAAAPPVSRQVGPSGGGTVVPTGQLVRPAGASVSFVGRPVDLARSADGKWLYAKDNRGIVVVEDGKWEVVQELPFPRNRGGGSMHGLAVRGRRLYATTAQHWLHEGEIGDDGRV